MLNKRSLFAFLFISLFFISFASAKPPVTTEFVGDSNLVVEANVFEYYPINEGATVFIHVFNKSNGVMLDDAEVDCDVELTSKNGSLVFSGVPTFSDHHWVMTRPSTVVTERGKYALIIHCNSTSIDGYKTFFFEANEFGEGLDIAHSFKFNSAMFFMLVLFMMAIAGLIFSEHYIAKFAFYWVAHLIFIAGNFCIWQFNIGYTTTFTGMASVWKIMFYLGVWSVLPMVILSMAWILYLHAYNENFEKVIKNGGNTEEAFRIADKKSSGWFNGR